MVVHLLTNASLLNSDASFQKNVHSIHSLGTILPLVEWLFIFGPILFHSIIGIVIIRGGLPNSGAYPYGPNIRYTLQRVTGIIAFIFIFWHVFHMHGWFHFEAWSSVAERLNGANFRPYNAATSVYLAMQGFVIPVLYFLGVAASVFHLANGLWTMGITWGVWTSPKAQDRAGWACLSFGVALMLVTVGIMIGIRRVDPERAYAHEKQAIEVRRATGEITDGDIEHKAFSDAEFREKLQRLRGSRGVVAEGPEIPLSKSPTAPKEGES
jgi:succinate dehydrogenase / fumarate reductase cytochrome b subunit